MGYLEPNTGTGKRSPPSFIGESQPSFSTGQMLARLHKQMPLWTRARFYKHLSTLGRTWDPYCQTGSPTICKAFWPGLFVSANFGVNASMFVSANAGLNVCKGSARPGLAPTIRH